ncbi:MAG: hypothetical protein VB142_04930 [Burkholderia sp.]
MARTRQIGDQTTTQQTCLISSRPMKVVEMSRLVRAHWETENQLHWVLDISWGEDAKQNTQQEHATKPQPKISRAQDYAEPSRAWSNSGDRRRVSLKNIRNLAAWGIDVRQSIFRLACLTKGLHAAALPTRRAMA